MRWVRSDAQYSEVTVVIFELVKPVWFCVCFVVFCFFYWGQTNPSFFLANFLNISFLLFPQPTSLWAVAISAYRVQVILFLSVLCSMLQFVFLPTCKHIHLHHLHMVFSCLYLKLEPLFYLLHYAFVLWEIIGSMDKVLPKLHHNASWILLKKRIIFFLLPRQWSQAVPTVVCFLGQSNWFNWWAWADASHWNLDLKDSWP